MPSEETLFRKRLFLEAYRTEKTVAGALRLVEQKHKKAITRGSVTRWMESDSDFRRKVKEVEDEIVDDLIDKLMGLAEQGDRQAIMTLLKRYRPEEFGDDDRGPAIQIVSEIPRPLQWKRTKPEEASEAGSEGQDDTASV